jgi:hypothetical protein
VHTGFCGETLGKETIWKSRCRWEDIIKMYLHDVGWVGMDWIELAQNMDRCQALVNAIMNLQFP